MYNVGYFYIFIDPKESFIGVINDFPDFLIFLLNKYQFNITAEDLNLSRGDIVTWNIIAIGIINQEASETFSFTVK